MQVELFIRVDQELKMNARCPEARTTPKHLHYPNYGFCGVHLHNTLTIRPLISCRHAEEAFIREIASTPSRTTILSNSCTRLPLSLITRNVKITSIFPHSTIPTSPELIQDTNNLHSHTHYIFFR